MDFVQVNSRKQIESVVLISAEGKVLETFFVNGIHQKLALNKLVVGNYFLLISLKDGSTEIHKVVKI